MKFSTTVRNDIHTAVVGGPRIPCGFTTKVYYSRWVFHMQRSGSVTKPVMPLVTYLTPELVLGLQGTKRQEMTGAALLSVALHSGLRYRRSDQRERALGSRQAYASSEPSGSLMLVCGRLQTCSTGAAPHQQLRGRRNTAVVHSTLL